MFAASLHTAASLGVSMLAMFHRMLGARFYATYGRTADTNGKSDPTRLSPGDMVRCRHECPLEEYFASVYEPDCDYITRTREPNPPGSGVTHLAMGRRLAADLLTIQSSSSGNPQCSVSVNPPASRVVDIPPIFPRRSGERAFSRPPCLFLEILSRDRMSPHRSTITGYLSRWLSDCGCSIRRPGRRIPQHRPKIALRSNRRVATENSGSRVAPRSNVA